MNMNFASRLVKLYVRNVNHLKALSLRLIKSQCNLIEKYCHMADYKAFPLQPQQAKLGQTVSNRYTITQGMADMK